MSGPEDPNECRLQSTGDDGPVGSGGTDTRRQRLLDPDYVTGWDPSLGPVEISQEEIDTILSRKALDQFDDDEIVSTVERRGMVIGFKKDGSSCVLKERTMCITFRHWWLPGLLPRGSRQPFSVS